MKIHRFVETLFAAAFIFALLLVNPSTATSAPGQQSGYSARLISPTAGQVLYPGQKVRVEWSSTLPHIDLGACEAEVWLSLDGGSTYTSRISPWLGSKDHSFYWTIPNTPTNAAVMDVRFGCESQYPESFAPQPASMFVIAETAGNN
jgi:hypothetical protein